MLFKIITIIFIPLILILYLSCFPLLNLITSSTWCNGLLHTFFLPSKMVCLFNIY
jgi:hypothetical protein